jgi:hypothetical protein
MLFILVFVNTIQQIHTNWAREVKLLPGREFQLDRFKFGIILKHRCFKVKTGSLNGNCLCIKVKMSLYAPAKYATTATAN